MNEHLNELDMTDRSLFHFIPSVRGAFSFLMDAGFTEVEALPTLVRYRKDDIEIDVHHGRQSYEIGCGFTVAGARYSLSDFMRVGDPDLAKYYRFRAATSPESVATGLEDLSVMVQRYGAAVLSGDLQFLVIVSERREQWLKEYSLDRRAEQIRPQAESAFRQGDYAKAAELYGLMRERLSPAEAKKLAFAEGRRVG